MFSPSNISWLPQNPGRSNCPAICLGPRWSMHLTKPSRCAVADIHEAALADVAGTPLWLRAEPQDSAEMSAALAAELDRWSASCGG